MNLRQFKSDMEDLYIFLGEVFAWLILVSASIVVLIWLIKAL